MTFQKLASAIAKREGKKSQVRIGDIREILKILVELDVEYCLKRDGYFFDGPLHYLDKRSTALMIKLRAREERKERKGK